MNLTRIIGLWARNRAPALWEKSILVWDKQKYIKQINTLSNTIFEAAKLKKSGTFISFSAQMFKPHSNLYWKIATLFSMFAALGSVHDNEQSKVIKITEHGTRSIFVSHVMPTCQLGMVLLPFFHALFPSWGLCAVPHSKGLLPV